MGLAAVRCHDAQGGLPAVHAAHEPPSLGGWSAPTVSCCTPRHVHAGRDAAETLVEVRHGGPVAAQPAQERRKPSSDTQPS